MRQGREIESYRRWSPRARGSVEPAPRGRAKQIDQAGLLAWPSSASINLPARMHSGLAMDLSGLQQRGLRRTGWPDKTPASPDFPFHPVAWQCGREPESNEVAAYPRARRSGKQGKRTGVSGRSVHSIPHPTHRECCGWLRIGRHQRATAESSVFFAVISRMRWRTSGSLTFTAGMSSLVRKNTPVNRFSLTDG